MIGPSASHDVVGNYKSALLCIDEHHENTVGLSTWQINKSRHLSLNHITSSHVTVVCDRQRELLYGCSAGKYMSMHTGQMLN